MPIAQRPLYTLVPKQWETGKTLDFLLAGVDQKLKESGDFLEDFHTWLDPDLCPDKALDYLGWLNGHRVWSTRWTVLQKRNMLRETDYLRRNRGTVPGFLRACTALGLPTLIRQLNKSTLPLKLSSPLRTGSSEYWVTLGPRSTWDGADFRSTRALTADYLPAGTGAKVAHRLYYLGITPLGQPLFNS
jgi:hypothetical protein